MVTVALRLILNKEEFPNEIIEEFAKANTIRNNIIHEAKTNVSREDEEKAYKMVSYMMSIIHPKIYEY